MEQRSAGVAGLCPRAPLVSVTLGYLGSARPDRDLGERLGLASRRVPSDSQPCPLLDCTQARPLARFLQACCGRRRSFSVTSRGLKPTENSGSTTPGPVLLAEEPGVGCRLARGRSRRRERTSSGGLVTSSRAGMLGSPVSRAGEGRMEGRERLPSWNPGAANPLWAWYPAPAAPASLRENGTN